MNGYEWHVHRREQNYRSTSGNFVKFSSSVNRLSEKIYSQQAVYTAYTHLERRLRDLSEANLREEMGLNPMPAIAVKLSDAERADLAAYFASLPPLPK
jgi:cytochrome c553